LNTHIRIESMSQKKHITKAKTRPPLLSTSYSA
jgi:hypothetical protein